MFKQQQVTKRTTVDIDTRRAVFGVAANRKPIEVARVNHETFIRQELKSKMGWPQRENAPESIKQAAREMAAGLVQRDLEQLAKVQKAKLDASKKAAAELSEEMVKDLRTQSVENREHDVMVHGELAVSLLEKLAE